MMSNETVNPKAAQAAPACDPVAELEQLRARTAMLEQLRVQDDAQKVKGHRPAQKIQADLDAAKATHGAMVLERDKQHGQSANAKRLREGLERLERSRYSSAGVPFDKAEWEATQQPLPTIPAELSRDLHRQAYVIAALEKELIDLAEALGPKHLV